MHRKKPKLGQNFLVDPHACRQIVEALGDISGTDVLEVGPGHGALTTLLAGRAKNLIAVELDPTLASRLSETWQHNPHVTILHDDILNLDLSEIRTSAGIGSAGPLFVVGNLPYYITSDILLRLFEQACRIQRIVIMVQKEVADRLTASPGTRAYGVLSATGQMHARMEKLFTLPPEAFSPPPEVTSAVVRMEMHPRFAELQVDRSGFLRFIQACFQQKRKTLLNNLKRMNPGDIQAASTILTDLGLNPAVRTEEIPLETMALMYRRLQNIR